MVINRYAQRLIPHDAVIKPRSLGTTKENNKTKQLSGKESIDRTLQRRHDFAISLLIMLFHWF